MKKQTLSVVINVISTPFVTSQRPGFGTVLTNTVSTSKKKGNGPFCFFVHFLIGYIHCFLWFFQNMGPLMLKSPHSFSIKMLLSSRRWLTTGSLWLAFPEACNNMTRRVRCRGDNDPVLNKQHFRRSNWVCLCCSRQQTGGRSRWGFQTGLFISEYIWNTPTGVVFSPQSRPDWWSPRRTPARGSPARRQTLPSARWSWRFSLSHSHTPGWFGPFAPHRRLSSRWSLGEKGQQWLR